LLSAWAEAGQSSETFWKQTPASFDAVLAGINRRNQRETEADLWRAYTAASLSATASAGKLKPFNHYLRKLKPPVAQSPQEMLEALRAFQAQGANMTITRIERKPS